MAYRTQNAAAPLPQNAAAPLPATTTPRIYPGSQTAVLLTEMAGKPGWQITIAQALACIPARKHRSPRAHAREIVRDMTERGLICSDLRKTWAELPSAQGLSPEELALRMTLTQLGRDMLRHYLPAVEICQPQLTRPATKPSRYPAAAPHPEQTVRIAAIPHRTSSSTQAGLYIRPDGLDYMRCPSRLGAQRYAPRPHSPEGACS